jgi:hypothetical protein
MHAYLRPAALLFIMSIGLALTPITSADAASSSNRTSFDNLGVLVVNDLCAFPVEVTSHAYGDQTIVDTATTTIWRAHVHEVDTFKANGNTVTGGPYTWNLQVTLDADGNPVQASQTGTIVRIGLPNGEYFFVAGRADVLTAAVDYIFEPTSGVSKNRDALCAYLGS